MDDPERYLAGGPTDAELAAHLRALRQAVGFDAANFAERAEIGLDELRAIESGERKPSLDEMMRYADGFGMRLDTIVNLWRGGRVMPAQDE